MPAKIQALIVDDERLARNVIKKFLQEYDNIELVAESSTGLEALHHIEELKPDLVFLDIQMPDLNGFEVIKEVGSQWKPVYIFITAHNKYAVEAFEASALDYLLKPFTQERFDIALKKAFDHLTAFKESKVNMEIEKLLKKYSELKNPEGNPQYIQRILVKENKKISMLPMKDVYYIESSGDYVKLQLKSKCHLLNESLSNLESQLDPKQFLRIHRSFIVNIDYIKEFIPHFNGEYFVIMENDAQVKLSRSYKDQFKGLRV